MPKLSVPGGPRVRWESRRRGLVKIDHTIELSGCRIPVVLHIPRACFGDFDRELAAFHQVGLVLIEVATRARSGHGTVSRPLLFGRAKGRITFTRSRLTDLRRIVAELRTDGHDPAEDLSFYLYARCCCDFVAQLVTTPPRRVRADQRRLTLVLPAALVAVSALLNVKANEPRSRICARVKTILEEDDEVAAYVQIAEELGWNSHQALVVGLVDRAFRGAWEAVALPGLLYTASKDVALLVRAGWRLPPEVRYRDPRTVLREYLYGARAPLTSHWLEMRRRDPQSFKLRLEPYLRWAERIFLGPAGAAAADFRFV